MTNRYDEDITCTDMSDYSSRYTVNVTYLYYSSWTHDVIESF